jgi:hypothetical protein
MRRRRDRVFWSSVAVAIVAIQTLVFLDLYPWLATVVAAWWAVGRYSDLVHANITEAFQQHEEEHQALMHQFAATMAQRFQPSPDDRARASPTN